MIVQCEYFQQKNSEKGEKHTAFFPVVFINNECRMILMKRWMNREKNMEKSLIGSFWERVKDFQFWIQWIFFCVCVINTHTEHPQLNIIIQFCLLYRYLQNTHQFYSFFHITTNIFTNLLSFFYFGSNRFLSFFHLSKEILSEYQFPMMMIIITIIEKKILFAGCVWMNEWGKSISFVSFFVA